MGKPSPRKTSELPLQPLAFENTDPEGRHLTWLYSEIGALNAELAERERTVRRLREQTSSMHAKWDECKKDLKAQRAQTEALKGDLEESNRRNHELHARINQMEELLGEARLQIVAMDSVVASGCLDDDSVS